jgi:hypothetical protein
LVDRSPACGLQLLAYRPTLTASLNKTCMPSFGLTYVSERRGRRGTERTGSEYLDGDPAVHCPLLLISTHASCGRKARDGGDAVAAVFAVGGFTVAAAACVAAGRRAHEPMRSLRFPWGRAGLAWALLAWPPRARDTDGRVPAHQFLRRCSERASSLQTAERGGPEGAPEPSFCRVLTPPREISLFGRSPPGPETTAQQKKPPRNRRGTYELLCLPLSFQIGTRVLRIQ